MTETNPYIKLHLGIAYFIKPSGHDHVVFFKHPKQVLFFIVIVFPP